MHKASDASGDCEWLRKSLSDFCEKRWPHFLQLRNEHSQFGIDAASARLLGAY